MTFWHWIVHAMGVDYGVPYGRWIWYSFWSGFFSCVTIFTGFAVFAWHTGLYYRVNNCVVHRCARIGKFTTSEGHKTCRKHHPEISAPLTAVMVADGHWKALGETKHV